MTDYSTIVAHVEDRPGVLARVASLFRRRGFNIESLTVGKADEPGLSRMTIVVEGGTGTVQQVERQLFKLIDVVSVVDISDKPMVDREMSLIKVRCQPAQLVEVGEMVKAFRADIVDVGPDSVIVQVLGDGGKVEALEAMLRPYGILEMVRTGRVAMVRGVATSKPSPISPHEAEAEAARAQLGRRPEGALPFTSD
ncbi:MAG: acetolactate synthase-1/3 small subunit [Chloroflexi bacterium]|nr:MAG: acetolactate synthase-1/3 small subunit [Chloroflexota bacterium]